MGLPCSEANSKALPFGNRDYTQANSLLEIIHTDLAGPMNVLALGGFKYIITFTDDSSRYISVYLLENKSDATQAFIKFANLATNQHGCKIKRLHSDLGEEFMDNTWKNYNETNRIICTQAPRKTPQLNGIAEVANRILFNKARAMMADANLPKALWGEAIKTAALLKNCSPTKVKKQTPYFHWFNKKPEISFLRVWGSLAIMLDPKSKIDNVGSRGVLVGYNNTLTAYKILDLTTHAIKESRHVRFDENFYPLMLGVERHELKFDSSENANNEEFLPQTTYRPITSKNPVRYESTQPEYQVDIAQPLSIQQINDTHTEQEQPPNLNNEPNSIVSPKAPSTIPTEEKTATHPSAPKISLRREFQNIVRSRSTRTPNPKYVNITQSDRNGRTE